MSTVSYLMADTSSYQLTKLAQSTNVILPCCRGRPSVFFLQQKGFKDPQKLTSVYLLQNVTL